MKRMTGLWRSGLAALLLWCAWPALAAELPPLSLADAKAKQAVILDTRPSYFYQGWPMALGNVVMGLVFGWWYLRTRRVMPLVVAHTALDVVSFVGYALAPQELLDLLNP